jgi:hypothetical protein
VTAINFMARPALAAHDDLLDQLIMYAPGGISYGAFERPRRAADPAAARKRRHQRPANYLAETRKVIQRAFFEDLYIAARN